MSVKVDIEVKSEGAIALVARLEGSLRDPVRLHRFIANRAENLTRDYLRGIAQVRHKTAERFGASPSGHLGRAAENVTSQADSEGAFVGVSNPGITRAVRDVVITPTNAKFLTIPVNANAYGRRASTLERSIGIRLFRPLRKGAKAQGSNLVLGPGKKGDRAPGRRSKRFRESDRMNVLAGVSRGRLVIFYALARRVVQRQDRTLLPSDAAYEQAAIVGAREFIGALLAANRNGGQ